MLRGWRRTGARAVSFLPAAGDRSAGMSRSRNPGTQERGNQVVRIRSVSRQIRSRQARRSPFDLYAVDLFRSRLVDLTRLSYRHGWP
jgi:hypothetical protein